MSAKKVPARKVAARAVTTTSQPLVASTVVSTAQPLGVRAIEVVNEKTPTTEALAETTSAPDCAPKPVEEAPPQPVTVVAPAVKAAEVTAVPLTEDEASMIRSNIHRWLPHFPDMNKALPAVCDALSRSIMVVLYVGDKGVVLSLEQDLAYTPENVGIVAIRHGSLLQVLNETLHVFRQHKALGA